MKYKDNINVTAREGYQELEQMTKDWYENLVEINKRFSYDSYSYEDSCYNDDNTYDLVQKYLRSY